MGKEVETHETVSQYSYLEMIPGWQYSQLAVQDSSSDFDLCRGSKTMFAENMWGVISIMTMIIIIEYRSRCILSWMSHIRRKPLDLEFWDIPVLLMEEILNPKP